MVLEHRDADKGDETRAKPKLGLKGRRKRLAEDTGEQSDGEEGDVAREPKFSKAAAKRAKVEHACRQAFGHMYLYCMSPAHAHRQP